MQRVSTAKNPSGRRRSQAELVTPSQAGVVGPFRPRVLAAANTKPRYGCPANRPALPLHRNHRPPLHTRHRSRPLRSRTLAAGSVRPSAASPAVAARHGGSRGNRPSRSRLAQDPRSASGRGEHSRHLRSSGNVPMRAAGEGDCQSATRCSSVRPSPLPYRCGSGGGRVAAGAGRDPRKCKTVAVWRFQRLRTRSQVGLWRPSAAIGWPDTELQRASGRSRQTIPTIFMTRTTRTADTTPERQAETQAKIMQVLTASRAADR